ncbi:MAG: hypothetical protein ABIH48_02400 [Candidatus Falkowbacteria bacterium]
MTEKNKDVDLNCRSLNIRKELIDFLNQAGLKSEFGNYEDLLSEKAIKLLRHYIRKKFNLYTLAFNNMRLADFVDMIIEESKLSRTKKLQPREHTVIDFIKLQHR